MSGASPAGLDAFDECFEQSSSDAVATRILGDVHGVFDDAYVAIPGRRRRHGRPADDRSVLDGDQPMVGKAPHVELLPRGRLGLEGRCAGRDALLVDLVDRRPVRCNQWSDFEHGPA